MQRLTRWPAWFLIVMLVLTIGLLPPWEICIHADGSDCGETKQECCGKGGATDPAAPCPDCLDIAPVVVGLASAPHAVSAPSPIAGALLVPATLQIAWIAPADAPVADRPPPSLDPPPIALTLRC